jgi:3-oxoacyl-[acyl-carrier protein] reductase
MIIQYPDLKNKIILVTGATRGIGKTVAEALAIQGAHVVFNYRQGKNDIAEAFKKRLIELGANKATPLLFDLTHTAEMKDAFISFTKEHGNISGLVNNAGISKDQIILRLKEDDVGNILDTNLKGTILLTSLLSRYFLKAENVSVVNVSSIVGLMGNPSQCAYAASKAGLLGFTKSFAKELALKGVRCNAICPGFIKTDMTENLEDKVKEAYLSSIPVNRFGETEEISNLVSFLLSQASSYITGEIIKIDGGLYI